MKQFAKLKYNEVETKRKSSFETSFTIKPLERGYGNTLGNALRRVLLSSISGVAPFAIRIKGIVHEYETISGIKEDVVQIILNLKTLSFVYNKELFKDNEIIRVYLKSKGAGELKAKHLLLPPGLEVVDKDHYIATIARGGEIELEIYLISGRGFISFEENKDFIKKVEGKMESKIETGTYIAIDSDFSPVKNVSYSAVELNTSSPTIQEQLTINVKTDGSVEAKNAMAQAADILIGHLQLLSDISNLEKEEIFEKVDRKYEKTFAAPLTINSLELSVRSYNCLKRAGYKTLDQISKISLQELKSIKNLGQKSVNEIIEKLKENNITLKEEE